jgi:hypothetical protein
MTSFVRNDKNPFYARKILIFQATNSKNTKDFSSLRRKKSPNHVN